MVVAAFNFSLPDNLFYPDAEKRRGGDSDALHDQKRALERIEVYRTHIVERVVTLSKACGAPSLATDSSTTTPNDGSCDRLPTPGILKASAGHGLELPALRGARKPWVEEAGLPLGAPTV